MDNKPEYLSIEIPYKSSLTSVILGYAASYKASNMYKCNSISLLDNDEFLDLELAHGITKIPYQDEIIIIDYKKYGEPVGLYFSAEVYERVFVKIEYNLPSEKDTKLKLLEKFFIDAKDFFDRKDEKEIICKILRNGSWCTLAKLPKRKMSTIYL